MAGVVSQWQTPCLGCPRPLVWSTAPKIKEGEKEVKDREGERLKGGKEGEEKRIVTQFLFWLGGLRIAWECKHTISNKNVGDLFGCHTTLGSFPSDAGDHGSEQLYVLPELACTANSWKPTLLFFKKIILFPSVFKKKIMVSDTLRLSSNTTKITSGFSLSTWNSSKNGFSAVNQ